MPHRVTQNILSFLGCKDSAQIERIGFNRNMEDPKQDQITRIVREAVRSALATAGHTCDAAGPGALFHSARAESLKQEIVAVGRKLWARAYVDGNGGNISARLSPRYVLCTPTLISKGDLAPEDICMVDLDNNLICGAGAQTSEIRLHLEIYKKLPQAMAVVHCHPPHATAHAIAGVVPPPHLLPEQEVFVGPVAISAYDTPGTASFAKSILPFIESHRTLLLANHGVVSWAGTVTHAEWAIEILETYCITSQLARQLNPALPAISAEKLADLLAVKKQLGIPDPRFEQQPAVTLAQDIGFRAGCPSAQTEEHLVRSLTRQVMAFLGAAE